MKHPNYILKKVIVISIYAIASLISSCNSLSGHEVFLSHMEANVGKKIDSRTTLWVKEDRYVGKRELSNGNIENEYKLDMNCHYYFQFNPATRIIVDWRFEGNVKECSIAP